MNRSRACLACRSANTKCDLNRPTCGRCAQHGLFCSGLPLDSIFLFRDENEVAKRNSQRTRRQHRQSSITPLVSSNSLVSELQAWPFEVASDIIDQSLLWKQYSWLNEHALAEVPEPLKRDVETRAVERFFINWTLHPSNNGGSPGHMHELPMLFSSAQKESVLWLAVRAVAFADMRNENAGNIPFHTKAQQHYGAALNRMRTVVNDQQDLGNDNILFAMLLIDNFELIYLARNYPLSPHSEAIKHVLYNRGDGQLYSPTRFSLWRLAHYRLQFWQTLFHEHPDDQQISWVNRLNMECPDLRICSHVLRMNILSAVAKSVLRAGEKSDAMIQGKLNQMKQLVREIQEFLVDIEQWTSEMSGPWKANKHESQNIVSPQELNEIKSYSIPHFPYPQLLRYDDIWLAYIWNFHAASQIALRESLVEIVENASGLQGGEELDENDKSVIQTQKEQVAILSNTILESIPQLLGLIYRYETAILPQAYLQGKMVGRLFALFSIWVVQRAKFTSAQQKQTASEVVAWINLCHGLG